MATKAWQDLSISSASTAASLFLLYLDNGSHGPYQHVRRLTLSIANLNFAVHLNVASMAPALISFSKIRGAVEAELPTSTTGTQTLTTSQIKMASKFPLLSLSLDLIFQIADYLPTVSIASLTQTCSALQYLLDRFLYQTIVVATQYKLEILAQRLEDRPERLEYIRSLRVGCNDLALKEFLPRMSNLRKWRGRLVRTSQKQGALLLGLRIRQLNADIAHHAPPLQHLRSVTLSYNRAAVDSNQSDLAEGLLAVFNLPALRDLKLTSATRYISLEDVPIRYIGTSSVKLLILTDGEIAPEGLSAMLSLPKALETLHINEFKHDPIISGSYPPQLERNRQVSTMVMQAVCLQRHSLRCLKDGRVDGSSLILYVPPEHALSTFDALEEVMVSFPTYEHDPRLLPQAAPRLPPNLQVLKYVIDGWDVQKSSIEALGEGWIDTRIFHAGVQMNGKHQHRFKFDLILDLHHGYLVENHVSTTWRNPTYPKNYSKVLDVAKKANVTVWVSTE